MMYGIEVAQLREQIVAPVLRYLDLYSKAAEQLVLGTALVESHGSYLKQLGKGPALGLWQMEPATAYDIWHNYLTFNLGLGAKVAGLMTALDTDDEVEMIGNLYYGCAMCRVHYRRVKASLPEAGDTLGLAHYWKSYYNTVKGAGNVVVARTHFEAACRE